MHDYESMGWLDPNRAKPYVLEAYKGTEIVQWYGNIERQLQGFVGDAEQSRNQPYTTKLDTFLNKVWRPNEISGSMNRETLEALLAGATVLGVDDWTYQNYFSNLRDQLRKLIASEEELPRGMGDENEPLGGTSRGGGPPLNPEFGPDAGGPGDETMDLEAEMAAEEGNPDAGEPGADEDINPDEEFQPTRS